MFAGKAWFAAPFHGKPAAAMPDDAELNSLISASAAGMPLFWHPVQPFRKHVSWGTALGLFAAVAAAPSGVVWTLGQDGRAYAFL